MICHTQNEILKQKISLEVGFEGMAKLLKAFFLRLYLLVCQNCETLKVPTRAIFRPLI